MAVNDKITIFSSIVEGCFILQNNVKTSINALCRMITTFAESAVTSIYVYNFIQKYQFNAA